MGIQFELNNGKKILIGTQESGKFKAAIDKAIEKNLRVDSSFDNLLIANQRKNDRTLKTDSSPDLQAAASEREALRAATAA
jgi:predicted nucleotidyltransferase